jgi:hypothetical protein
VSRYRIFLWKSKKFNNKVLPLQEPVWDCEVDFTVPDGPDRVVAIEVFDADKFGKDKSLGHLLLDIAEVAAQGASGEGRWYPLAGVPSGQILLTADFLPLGGSATDGDTVAGAAKRLRDSLQDKGKSGGGGEPVLTRADSKGRLGGGAAAAGGKGLEPRNYFFYANNTKFELCTYEISRRRISLVRKLTVKVPTLSIFVENFSAFIS